MNIVITQNSNGAASASLTQYSSNLSYLLSDIRVYHNLTLDANNNENLTITFVSSQGFTYPMTLKAVTLEDKKTPLKQGDFTAFSLSPVTTLPEENYTITVSINKDNKSSSISIGSVITLKKWDPSEQSSGMFDEHNCLLVVDRRIQIIANQVSLIAEDNNSQEIRFKIRKRYDNISFLDSSKDVFVDFIPVDWDEFITTHTENVSDELSYVSVEIPSEHIYPDPLNEDYMIIRWVVPNAVTWRAGQVTIALSICSEDEDYVWQTATATLTVQPNIGLRNNKASNILLDSQMGHLAQRIGQIEELFKGDTLITLHDESGEEA